MSACAYAAKIAFAQIIKKYKKHKLQWQAIWVLWILAVGEFERWEWTAHNQTCPVDTLEIFFFSIVSTYDHPVEE